MSNRRTHSLLLPAVFLLAAPAFAQEFRGTLMGRITDPTGLGVPNAKIVITKTDSFGMITGQANTSRQIQMGLKVNW